MKYVVELSRYKNEFWNIMMIEFKILQFEKVLDIAEVSGDKIVHADDMIIFLDKSVAKVWAQKARSSCD